MSDTGVCRHVHLQKHRAGLRTSSPGRPYMTSASTAVSGFLSYYYDDCFGIWCWKYKLLSVELCPWQLSWDRTSTAVADLLPVSYISAFVRPLRNSLHRNFTPYSPEAAPTRMRGLAPQLPFAEWGISPTDAVVHGVSIFLQIPHPAVDRRQPCPFSIARLPLASWISLLPSFVIPTLAFRYGYLVPSLFQSQSPVWLWVSLEGHLPSFSNGAAARYLQRCFSACDKQPPYGQPGSLWVLVFRNALVHHV